MNQIRVLRKDTILINSLFCFLGTNQFTPQVVLISTYQLGVTASVYSNDIPLTVSCKEVSCLWVIALLVTDGGYLSGNVIVEAQGFITRSLGEEQTVVVVVDRGGAVTVGLSRSGYLTILLRRLAASVPSPL